MHIQAPAQSARPPADGNQRHRVPGDQRAAWWQAGSDPAGQHRCTAMAGTEHPIPNGWFNRIFFSTKVYRPARDS
eukprot:831639-Prymnesium_polylepis.1